MLTNKQAIEYIDSILSNYNNPKEVDRHYPDYRLCEVWLSRYDLEALKMAIQALEQEPRWIPVSERLPETNIYDGHGPVWKHKVLITGYLSFDDKKETFITTAFAEDVRNECVPDINVIAWMPFPELYKAESEGKDG